MAQGGEFFPALKSKLKSFSICDLEAWTVQVKCRSEAVLSPEKKKSFDLLVLKLSIPVCGRVKRPFAGWGLPGQGNVCATAVGPTKTWSGETPQSLTETWTDVQKAHGQLMWALAGAVCSELGLAGGGWPLRLHWEGKWWVCGVRFWLDISSWCDELCHQSPAGTPAASSCCKRGDFSCKELFLSVRGALAMKGGSKDLSSSRWIATHLVNQLIKCNEYPALGKPSERPHNPLYREFPTSSSFNLAVQWLFYFFFCYIIYRVNISVILSSSAVGSILRNNNQV